jgi:regulator of protease activity HflC (stomatin/prohibitin superfamily)
MQGFLIIMIIALMSISFFLIFAFIFAFIFLLRIKQIDQYERGVMFTRGKFVGIKDPGWVLYFPLFQKIRVVDIRTRAVDVPYQEAITRDNIPVRINAVVYYSVKEVSRAVLEVMDYADAISQLAQTTMRNAIGERELDELLQNRAQIADQIKIELDTKTDRWGIDVSALELKDVVIPEELKRTISKEAEAEREKRAVIIKAQGDKEAAKNLSAAAAMLAQTPGALHLRTLQAINDLSSDQSNTTIWMIPTDALEAVKGFSDVMKTTVHQKQKKDPNLHDEQNLA